MHPTAIDAKRINERIKMHTKTIRNMLWQALREKSTFLLMLG
jgi:hypothetical protein